MNVETENQYYAAINHISNDNTEAARAIISNLMAQKIATQLQQHNITTAQQNIATQDAIKALVKKP